MKDDLETFVAMILAVILSLLMWATACVVLGFFAKLMWIPLTYGWNLI